VKTHGGPAFPAYRPVRLFSISYEQSYGFLTELLTDSNDLLAALLRQLSLFFDSDSAVHLDLDRITCGWNELSIVRSPIPSKISPEQAFGSSN
jgi:hypothetical protein